MNKTDRVQLSEIASLITKGTTPTTIGYDFQDSGINFLKIECFDEYGNYVESKVAHISDECNEKLKRSQLKSGDILFSIAGAIGRVAIVTDEMLPANTNQALAIIRIVREDVYLPFIKLILLSPFVKEQFEKKKQGVAQLNISLKDISELTIPLPEINEQIALAALFEKVEGIINKRQQLISALDNLIKARFVEMFGDLAKGVGGYPVEKIGSLVANIVPGWSANGEARQKTCGEKAVLKVSAVTQGYFKPEEHKALSVETEIKKYVFPRKGDLLFSRANTKELVGATAIIDRDYPDLILSDKLWRVIFSDAMNVYYAKYVLSTEFIRGQFSAKSTGTSGSMFNVSADKFRDVAIPVPPRMLQDSFAVFVRQVDKLKSAIQKSIDETRVLFDSLMQQYFC